MKIHLLLCFLLFTIQSQAQSLEQYVISSAGNYSTNSNGASLSATMGEAVTTTENSATAFLTQGFHQPLVVSSVNINKLNQQAVSISVFPNPTQEQITVQKNFDGSLNAELIDILGQTIGHYQLQNRHTQINLSQFPAANYLLRIQNQDQQQIQIFKIQKIQ